MAIRSESTEISTGIVKVIAMYVATRIVRLVATVLDVGVEEQQMDDDMATEDAVLADS